MVGEMLWFLTNQLFTLRIIVYVNGESNIKYYTDCIVFTLIAPHHWVTTFSELIIWEFE